MATPCLVIFAEKGGVGKSTLSLSIGGSYAEQGKRVLFIDADKQANLSKTLKDEREVLELHPLNTLAAILDPDMDPEPEHLIHPTAFENIFILPANRWLKNYLQPAPEILQASQWSLRQFITHIEGGFDLILIDTPPDIDVLPAWASLLAAQAVLTPVEPERYSGQSLNGVWLQLKAAQEVHPSLRFLGYVLNKFDGRRTMHRSYEENLRKLHGDLVFQTVLRNLGAFAEAQHFSKPINLHDPKSKAAGLARELTNETIQRMTQPAKGIAA